MAEERVQEAQVTGLTKNGTLTPAFLRQIWFDGLIGTKEFRAWLGAVDQKFAEVRDADVDNEIDQRARERNEARLAEERQYLEEQERQAAEQ